MHTGQTGTAGHPPHAHKTDRRGTPCAACAQDRQTRQATVPHAHKPRACPPAGAGALPPRVDRRPGRASERLRARQTDTAGPGHVRLRQSGGRCRRASRGPCPPLLRLHSTPPKRPVHAKTAFAGTRTRGRLAARRQTDLVDVAVCVALTPEAMPDVLQPAALVVGAIWGVQRADAMHEAGLPLPPVHGPTRPGMRPCGAESERALDPPLPGRVRG
jgi:hypothetical protein